MRQPADATSSLRDTIANCSSTELMGGCTEEWQLARAQGHREVSMSIRRPMVWILFPVLIAFAAASRTQSGCGQPGQGPRRYVKITSVQVVPGKIHGTLEPNTATVTVKVFTIKKDGTPTPGNAKATVRVDSYSTYPGGNNVRYSAPQTLPLKENLTVFTFKVYGSRDTVNGHLVINAAFESVSEGIEVQGPVSSDATRTTLETASP